MRVPIRKPGKYTHLKPDPHLTAEKIRELENKVARMKSKLPYLIEEVRRLALMGDFSENFAYQMAKGQLRGLNQRIADTEDHLHKAIIIKPSGDASEVRLGHNITVEVGGQEKIYLLLGSSETNPTKGVISHNSPIGAALLGHRVGEKVKVRLANKEVEYKIIKIF
jgi:transcription elongation factor GreA